MEKSCNDMRKIISDILDLSKIEANEISIDINQCNIKQFIEDLIAQGYAYQVDGDVYFEVGKLLSSMSSEVSNEDMDVIKRYSNIKERELREAQASAEALRRQIRYFDERLKKSEEERRKLILKVEEVQNELRTTSDKKDENRAQLKNIESHYEEKIKELQVQLESSQFQAGKLEKKLEDFRDRVRSDLQKIRSRERELASRLEIQKRDAEALLSAKDERLLNQKRDIDRLEFEIDSLRERLIDDVNRSEERRKRITRALQSLKLAQSVLSGLDEESLQKDEKNKAA
jgi:chromosome segregation ATPase